MAYKSVLSIILMKFLNHLSVKKASSQGFVLPLVIGLGLIMTVAGLTMVIRSSDENITTEQQQQKSKAKQAAETGISRMMSAFTRYPSLATKNKDQWQTILESDVWEQQKCDFTQLLGTVVNGNWAQAGSQSAVQIADYSYNKGTGVGTLTVNGTANIPNNIDINNMTDQDILGNNLPISSIRIDVPVEPSADAETMPTMAGLTDVSLMFQTVNGTVTIKGCTADNVSKENVDRVVADPFLEDPPLPKESEIDWKNEGGGAEVFNNGISNLTNESITLPDTSSHGNAQDTNDIYHYVLKGQGGNNDLSINLTGNDTIWIDAREKVALHLHGNILTKGNSRILFQFHDPTGEECEKGDYIINSDGTLEDKSSGNPCPQDVTPSTLQIYGGNGETGGFYSDGGTKQTSSEMCLGGTINISTFLLAPKVVAGLNGGGNDLNNVSIIGNIWIDRWIEGNTQLAGTNCGSNSAMDVAQTPNNWDLSDLLVEDKFLSRKINSPQNWQQLEEQVSN